MPLDAPSCPVAAHRPPDAPNLSIGQGDGELSIQGARPGQQALVRAGPARSSPRDHHRPAEAPEHQRGGDTRRRHQSGADPSGGVTRWTAQARQDRVPRRAADLMDKRARPRSKRPRPRSGRGVRCTRHPCRQASLRVSPRPHVRAAKALWAVLADGGGRGHSRGPMNTEEILRFVARLPIASPIFRPGPVVFSR